MLSLKSTFHLPDSKSVLVLHHDSQLLTWACSLALSPRACVAVHSATNCSCASAQLSQGEVVPQLVEACRKCTCLQTTWLGRVDMNFIKKHI